MNPSRRAVAPLFVLSASIAFATSGVLARVSRPAHPLTAACGRVLIAGAILFALEPLGTLRSLRALSPSAALRVLVAGALLAAHFACYLWGVDATSLPSAIALVSLEPLAVVVAVFLMHGERPTRGEAVGVLVATAGAFVVGRGAGSGDHRLAGDLLIVAAVALYGSYVGVVRGTRDLLPARHGAATIYLVAAMLLGVALVLVPPRAGSVRWPLPLHSAMAIAGLAFIPTLFGHTAVQTAARLLSPSIVALVSPGETAFGIVLAAIALGARPSAIELLGGAIIVLGATIAIFSAATTSHPDEGGGEKA